MTERRVVITGLGAVTATGIGAEEVFGGLLQGRTGIKPISLFDASRFPCSIGGQIDDFSATPYVPRGYRKAVKVMARDSELAVAAADLAVRDAGITTIGIDEARPDVDGHRLGCNVGAGLICADLEELGAAINTAVRDGQFDIHLWGREGINNLTPLWLLKYLPNMLACHVTIIHGAKGPSNTITCGEASGQLAVGEATRIIARGACDVAFAGGAESKLNPMGLLRQCLIQRVTTRNSDPASACRPFDVDHSGTVVGEGGGILILEELGRASARRAKIYAEVVGFGAAGDPAGVDYMRPAAGGVPGAVRAALADARLTADQIDLVVAHGTAVPAEDAAEAASLKAGLGEVATRVPTISITGAVGNLFAGAGGVQLVVAAMALKKQVVPPVHNCRKVAPECGLNVPAQALHRPLRHVLCVGYGVGGQSAAVILKRWEP